MAQRVKNLPANAEDVGDSGSIPGWGRPPLPQRRVWQATPVFSPEESHGQRSLGGPQGCEESQLKELNARLLLVALCCRAGGVFICF